MLIAKNQLLGEAGYILNNLERLDYVTYNESTFPPNMVNIRHNNRLQKDLVQLESFVEFGQHNGIDDGGYALHLVCEANDAPYDNLAFIVNEENLFADDELLENFIVLKESNFDVYVSPISDYSIYYTRLVEALNFDMAYPTYDESPALQSYVNESIFDTAKNKVQKGAKKVKGAVSGGIKEISGKMASIRKEIAKKAKKLLSATGSAKVMLKQQIDKLRNAFNSLKNKAIALKNSAANGISHAVNKVKNSAISAKDFVGDKLSSAKDAIADTAGGLRDRVSGAVDSVRSKFA